ncbi:talin 2 [Rhinolophus ferrumequinum]|uniref:Talin 2 n=1 Tax=Rhinolophus ferrumequinum TaxID=59479 RepID=A0A7J7XSM8_RHIFE|nr:talin 2 [Rhinolophus ferrumequinum]
MRRPRKCCRSGHSPRSSAGQPHPRASRWILGSIKKATIQYKPRRESKYPS